MINNKPTNEFLERLATSRVYPLDRGYIIVGDDLVAMARELQERRKAFPQWTEIERTDLRAMVLSEIGDFFSGFGSPGEPETPEKMQQDLSMRVGQILNSHIVNYPRCEALVEILKECRIARDIAQAELQERRKAALVIPDEMPVHTGPREFGRPQAYIDGWNHCRTALLAGLKTK